MLKKQILILNLALLLSPLTLFSQPIKSLTVGNQWYYHINQSYSHVGIHFDHILKYTIVGDTMINNLNYTKIERRLIDTKPNRIYPEIFEYADSTKVKTIYFTFPWSVKTERSEISYDFSISVGDTIINDSTSYYTQYFTVIEKGDTTLFDRELAFLKIKAHSDLYNDVGGYLKIFIVENIGIINIRIIETDNARNYKLLGAYIDGVVYNDTCFTLSWVKDITLTDNLSSATNPVVTISFLEDIDPTTLNNENIIINSYQSGRKSVQDFNYHPDTKLLEIDLNDQLFPGEKITVTVKNNLQNMNGEKNIMPFAKEFTVSTNGGACKFVKRYTINLNSRPLDICTGDFDLDGDLDFIVPTVQGFHLIKYNTESNQYFWGTQQNFVTRIIPADLDLDGDLDLAAIHNQNTNLYLFRNLDLGSSIFQYYTPELPRTQADYSNILSKLNEGTRYLAVADLDHNGFPEPITRLRGTGSLPINPHIILTADWNDDGFCDIAFHDNDFSKMLIYYNDGDGIFEYVRLDTISHTQYARNIASADIDNDNDLDFALSSGIILKNNGKGKFQERSYFELSGQSLATGDLDGDGDMDIIASQEKTLLIFLNDGKGNFEKHDIVDVPEKVFKIVPGDYDNDGDLDVSVIYYNLNVVEIFENQGEGTDVKIDGLSEIPCKFKLSQNYPNPFNSSTEIKYTIPHNKSSCHVTLKIYDIRGRVVNILVNQNQAAGTYSLRWNGRDMNEQEVSSGIYFYTLQADKFKATNKMLLIH